MRHQDLTINHRLETWIYANTAARTGATGFVPGDIGRIAYQSDNGTYWRLTDDSPTIWAPITTLGMGALCAQNGSTTGSITSLGDPGVMAGLPGTITPVYSGRIFVAAAGFCRNATPGGTVVVLRAGTGTKPIFGATPTGTAAGNEAFAGTTNPDYIPWSCNAMFFFAAGTVCWLDVAVWVAVGGSTTILYNSAIQAFEF